MSEKSESEKPELVARFTGLIEIVRNEALNNRLEFMAIGAAGGIIWQSGRITKRDGKSVNQEPPPSNAIPWAIPRRAEVERHLSADSNSAYFAAVCAWLNQHVDFERPEYVTLFGAWVVHSYLIDRVRGSPLLTMVGPPESGKTRTLNACIRISRRGIATMNVREAALIRYADEYDATLGLDVIDFMELSKNSSDFFAARTRNDGTLTTRIVDYSQGPFLGTRHYRAFGATLIASNGGFTNDMMASRALVIPACLGKRRFREDPDPAAALELCERGTAFRARVMTGAPPEVSDPDVADGRLGDILSGLVTAIQLCSPEELADLKALVPQFVSARRAELTETPEREVLRHCLEMLKADAKETIVFRLDDLRSSLNELRAVSGERLMTSQHVAGVLRATFGAKTWSGSQNYTFVSVSRVRLLALAERYGLDAPAPLVNAGEENEEVKK